MSDPRAKMVLVAHRLWDATAQHLGDSDDVLVICELLLTRLEARLRRWIGAEGYASLLSRSVAESIHDQPALTTIPNLVADETETAAMTANENEQRDAVLALLVTMMQQLGGIIGDNMAIRLIEQSGTPSPRGVAGSEHNEPSS